MDENIMIDMEADDKDNWGREGKKTKDVMVTGHGKQKKMKRKRKNEKEKVKEMEIHSGNKDENIEEKADREVPKSKKKAIASATADSSETVIVMPKSKKMKSSDEVEVLHGTDNEVPKSKKKAIASADSSKSKKVRLSDDVEVFPASDSSEKTKDVVVTGHEKKKKKKKGIRKGKKEKVKDMDKDENIEEKADCEVPKSKKRASASADSSKSKKVRFSDEVEVFPAFDSSESSDKSGLVQGKRFSAEENELIKKAVLDYIEVNHLGEEGLNMVLNCKSHPRVKGCWKEIGAALPWRPCLSVYQRAHRLFERGERNWTSEEIEFIRKSYKEHGPKWRMMADELGKNQHHLRQAFQRYKFGDLKKGPWSQDEYQALFELVNKDLMMSIFEEKKSRHGMLKDNIKWETISDKLGSRHNMACCLKWYNQLTSPMVAEGIWADSDDYRLLMVLLELDASCEDEVDWDYLLEHRSGDLCRKRWLQMARHLGENGNKSFSEQVEVLSERYCPDLAEVRDALDARPIVDISDGHE